MPPVASVPRRLGSKLMADAKFWRRGADRSGNSCKTCGCALTCAACSGDAPANMQVTINNVLNPFCCLTLQSTFLLPWIANPGSIDSNFANTCLWHLDLPTICSVTGLKLSVVLQLTSIEVFLWSTAIIHSQWRDLSSGPFNCKGFSNRNVPGNSFATSASNCATLTGYMGGATTCHLTAA